MEWLSHALGAKTALFAIKKPVSLRLMLIADLHVISHQFGCPELPFRILCGYVQAALHQTWIGEPYQTEIWLPVAVLRRAVR
jgi:hypothetical protein